MKQPTTQDQATVAESGMGLEAAVLTSMQTLRLFQYDDNGHLISWPSETWWRATITDVEAALSQIQEPLPSEDTKRLDWLEAMGYRFTAVNTRSGIRAAIDAAMSSWLPSDVESGEPVKEEK